MASVIAWLTKTVVTEKVLKSILVILGDYLVKSSKNKLDDAIWNKVKATLAK